MGGFLGGGGCTLGNFGTLSKRQIHIIAKKYIFSIQKIAIQKSAFNSFNNTTLMSLFEEMENHNVNCLLYLLSW